MYKKYKGEIINLLLLHFSIFKIYKFPQLVYPSGQLIDY